MTNTREDLHCLTKLNYRTIGIRWTIENYDVVWRAAERLKSPEFPEGEGDSQKWYLELKPSKITAYSNEMQDIFLKKTFKGDVYVDTELYFENDRTGIRREPLTLRLTDDKSIRFMEPVERLYKILILNEAVEKTLIINCKVRIFDSTQPTPEHVYGKISPQIFKSKDLSQDMSKFFVDDQTFKDVTISVQGNMFEAHKNILAARSEVFQAMFTNEMSEKNNSLVEIKDLTPEVVGKMLHFIYADKVNDEDLKKSAPELLDAAEKYNLQRLKEICVAAMHQNLAVGNVLNTIEIADLYSISNLKKEALKFLVTHRQVVKSQDEFETFFAKRPRLVADIIDI